MTTIEGLLVLILIGVIAFTLYYYFRGSTGRLDISRPLESRVDEYLDRKFDMLIEEWSLVHRSQAEQFRDEKMPLLAKDEERIAALKAFEKDFGEELTRLEERIEALEKQVPK